MVFHSELSKKEYLAAMKVPMGGHFEFGAERFTGFFIGNFFYVTYHSGREWNQRITNQKNAAMGFVTKAEEGCDVHFLRFRGLLCPLQFLSTFLILLLAAVLGASRNGIADVTSNLIIATVVMLIFAPIYTLIESATDASEEGKRILLSYLVNPKDPYGSIDYFP